MNGKRAIIGTLGAVVGVVGLVGVAHMPFARGLLMSAGGCPVGKASLAEVEPVAKAAVAKERGTVPAPARPALGFELDKSTRADVDAWADKSHVSCSQVREGLLKCTDVPAVALGLPESDGPATELHLGFDTKGHLVDVSTMRMHASAEPARDISNRLETQVGAPQLKTGAFDDAHLAQVGMGNLSQVRYRYSDYFAEVMAMRFKDDGIVVREHYRSAND